MPWLTLGGSVIAGAFGALYLDRTFKAVNETPELRLDAMQMGDALEVPEAFRDQQRSVLTNGVTATLLLSTATSAFIASLIALLD